MKKFNLYLLCVLSLFAVSCGKKESPVQKESGSIQNLQLPDWVIDPHVEGMIADVGIAPKTAGGIKMQIAQAEADARANIAAQIQTKVSSITKESMRRAAVASEKGETEAVDSYFAKATKSVVDQVPITGARRKNMFQSPVDGSLYIQMVVDMEPVRNYLIQSSEGLAKGLKNFNATQEAIKKTEDSMKDLFSELDLSTKNDNAK